MWRNLPDRFARSLVMRRRRAQPLGTGLGARRGFWFGLGGRSGFSFWLRRRIQIALGLSGRNQLGCETIADAHPTSGFLADASDGERPHYDDIRGHYVMLVARLKAAA